MQLPRKFWLPSKGILIYLLTCQPTAAQIIPDNTLPNNSIVTPDCIECEITGGTTAGNNLFHSFEQFNIPIGGSATFDKAATIENIISRVTGNLPSNIDGLISANGTANVFLINPNGIIFGSEAALNISGSFLATTADSINFADGTQFSATNPQSTPLLTVSLPVGLQFGQTPGKISNESVAPLVDFSTGELIVDEEGFPFFGGLQVPPGRTLALVGGQVDIPGGIITAPAGRIEIGSFGGNNLVSLTPVDRGWELGYNGIQNFQDINLSQAAFVDVSSFSGGDIQIQGKTVTLTGGSQVFNIAQAEGQAGTLRVGASESVELSGTPTDFYPTELRNEVEGDATGEGGSLTIDTRKLVVQSGAQVSTNTYGTGQGVNLRVNASEFIELSGISISPEFDQQPSGLFTRATPREDVLAPGNAGLLTIETGRLIVRDGAQVSTDTFGAGRAGDLRVIATDIEIAGRTPNNLETSGLFAQTNDQATGDSGDITIESDRLVVLGGAQISNAGRGSGQQGTININASDSILLSGAVLIQNSDNNRSGVFVSAEPGATGNAGELNVNTRLLTVEDGARISADNLGSGEVGGNATLNVRQLIIQSGGQARSGSFGSGSGGILNVNASEFIEITSNGTLFTQAQSSGDAGDLNINTRTLSVRDGGNVTVSSIGTGTAGELTISARSVELDDASLTATTNSGNGGNIQLQADDLLLLRRNSIISTRAGTPETSGGTGGIITIDTDNLVALENSDIDANAFGGAGGQVRINAQGIFGTQGREQKTPESDITASSDLGPQFSGTVEIITPDVDPSQGLVTLPVETVDASNQVATTCTNNSSISQGKFVISGRGGMPLNPGDTLSSDAVLTNWATLGETEGENISRRATTTSRHNNSPTQQIVEAQGWIVDANGKVFLTAQAPNVTPNHNKLNTTSCNGS